jgi:hypothetical protein
LTTCGGAASIAASPTDQDCRMLEISALSLPAVRLSIVAAGVFFSSGLLTGAWKYFHIARSANAQAPVYVDIAHRTSLFYSFAALLVAQFAALSAYSPQVNLWAAVVPLAFFAAAIAGYIVHGLLNDTDNQFRKPQKIGPMALPRGGLHGFMWLLMLGEIGGFAVLFAGVLKRLCEIPA